MLSIRKEGIFCGFIWSAYVFYLIYATYQTSEKLESSEMFKRYTSEGWKFLNRRQDTSDLEWLFWKSTLFPRLAAWMCLHTTTSLFLSLVQLHKLKKYFFLAISFGFLLTQVGFVSCVFYTSQIILVTTVALVTHSRRSVWILSLFFLSFIFTPSLKSLLSSITNTHDLHDNILLDYIFTMGMLRYTSCALCIVNAICAKDTKTIEKLINIKIRDGSVKNLKLERKTLKFYGRETDNESDKDGWLNGFEMEENSLGREDGNGDNETKLDSVDVGIRNAEKSTDTCSYNTHNDNECKTNPNILNDNPDSMQKNIFKPNYRGYSDNDNHIYQNNFNKNGDCNNNGCPHVSNGFNNTNCYSNCGEFLEQKDQYRDDCWDFDMSKEDWLTEADWFSILTYNFYLPLLATGPFLTYDSFCNQFSKPILYSNKRQLIKKLSTSFSKALFWTLVLEISTHYLYHHAIFSNPFLVSSLPLWTVAGSAYITGQCFMVKYFIIWTISSSVALLDGLVTPLPPSCISHIYLYSDMWKLFDKGFYEFLKCYIYIPLGGQRTSCLNQMVSLVLPFTFVYLWHGADSSMLVWTSTNVVAIFLEKCLADLYSSYSFEIFCQTHLSILNTRRLKTLILLPLFGLSTAGIFVFLASVQSSYNLVSRLFITGFPVSFVHLVIVGYCFVQFSKFRKDQRIPNEHSN